MSLWSAMIMFALVLVILAEVYGLLKIIDYAKENRVIRNRYKLFKVRDKFVNLVVTGKLDENDPVYTYFVSTLNLFIRYTEELRVSALIKGIVNGTEERIIRRREKLKFLLEDKQNNEDVLQTIHMMFSALNEILISNSLILRSLNWCVRICKDLIPQRLKEKIKDMVMKRRPEYSAHKALNEYEERTASMSPSAVPI